MSKSAFGEKKLALPAKYLYNNFVRMRVWRNWQTRQI